MSMEAVKIGVTAALVSVAAWGLIVVLLSLGV